MKQSINHYKNAKIAGLIMVMVFFLSACNVPTEPTPVIDDLVEKAMQTLNAQETQSLLETLVAQLTQTSQVTPTQMPTGVDTEVPTNTATLVPPTPTATLVPPTNTAIPPTNTPIPPTHTPIPCDIAKFVQDVTIPDGTTLKAGEAFTKTWRLTNVGTCSWTTEYDLVFVSGNSMSASAVVDLPRKVAPGESIDLSVSMVAPGTAGDYTGFWMLRNPGGGRFGVGKDATLSFWVKIKTVIDGGEVYSFADRVCDATWSSGAANPLPCPGVETSVANGYVLTKVTPYREDGAKENEIGLITRPNSAANGWIQGVYPAFLVKSGDEFTTAVNCEYNSPACNVYFELRYRIGSEAVQTLGKWHEAYEGKWKNIVIDLTPLAGKNVQFILYVWNGTTAADNNALWIRPSIWR